MSNPWIVLKFGGNSVADLECWKTIGKITHQHLANNLTPLIVCSALVGITNKLEQTLPAAIKGIHEPILEEVISAYTTLAKNLVVAINPSIEAEFTDLSRLLQGLSLTREITPSLQAKILAFGEVILTKIGATYLQTYHFPTTWCDARSLLKSINQNNVHPEQHYLAAKCDYQPDNRIQKQLAEIENPVLLTQGFIASNSKNETVLLGRGGSDTAAAYFAAKLNAVRCEIWTDVPGVYTANPHQIPESRLLKALDYDEAQEIAAMGAKVLHPYCIPPLKANKIPLYVGNTRQPHRSGTEITSTSPYQDIIIKSILTKSNITLVQIETVQMWQQVGFLADVFFYFKQHGLSIDLISTSESTVTVSLDLKLNNQDRRLIDTLLTDLNTFCKATKIESCAVISIVGHNIRTLLPKIGEALKVFAGQKIHLVSQASNNLNFSFVVDEKHALMLAKELHSLLIVENSHHQAFDRSWQEEVQSLH